MHECECNGQIDARKPPRKPRKLVDGKDSGNESLQKAYRKLGILDNITGAKETLSCQQHHDGDLFYARAKDQIHVFPQVCSIFSPRLPCAQEDVDLVAGCSGRGAEETGLYQHFGQQARISNTSTCERR